jgi:hypothetical protein
MWKGKSEEYNEIAENILLNLFYDENNLDLIAHTVRNYKQQSLGSVRSISQAYLQVLRRLHLSGSYGLEIA